MEQENKPTNPPPFLGSWPRMYIGLLLVECILIVLFYWVTTYYNVA